MSYECILWNNEGTSDKLWGVTDFNGQPVSFWGRRGRELKFKLISHDDFHKLRRDKIYKGDYRETSFEILEQMQPGFEADFKHMFTLCVISDGFHRMFADRANSA